MLSVSSPTINIESRARRVTKDASCSKQLYANVKFKTSDGTMFVIIWSFVIEHEVMMAVLQDFGYSQASFNYLDMCSNHTIKNEERKACLFDVDDFVNFPRGVPSTVVKSEPAPQFCRLPTPYSQPYPFAAARPGNYYDQFLYSKFTSMFLLVTSRLARATSRKRQLEFLIWGPLERQSAKFSRIVSPLFLSATFCLRILCLRRFSLCKKQLSFSQIQT